MPAVAVVGVVGAPFGVRGWVHVRSFTEPAANLLAYRPWQLALEGGAAPADPAGWREVRCAARRHGGGFVARFDDAADRDAARALRGATIGVGESALPPTRDREHYWRDLVGTPVVAPPAPQTGGAPTPLGAVAEVFATPAHDVLLVRGGHRERLIPFVRQVVLDVSAERVVVDWHPDWQ